MAVTPAVWKRIDAVGLDQAIDATSTTQVYKTGMTIKCRDTSTADYGEAVFMYAKGVVATVAYDCCVVSAGGGASVRATTRSIGPVGWAQSANVAANWGWYQVTGRTIANVATGFAASDKVYVTGTAGTVDDVTGVAAGDIVYGARSAGAVDTGLALIDIQYPHVNDTDNA